MKTDNQQTLHADRVWLSEEACDLDDFRGLAEKTTVLADDPAASAVEKNVLIYDSRKVMAAAATPECRRAV
ncbi:phytanoyl-CoA dioxygenase, partial [Rhizobium ruizarguesonis]